jgi:hypothetical protein
MSQPPLQVEEHLRQLLFDQRQQFLGSHTRAPRPAGRFTRVLRVKTRFDSSRSWSNNRCSLLRLTDTA